MLQFRRAMAELLEDWKRDVAPAWRRVLATVELDFEGVDPDLELLADEVVFPARRGHPPVGARADTHIFRALDLLPPDRVSVLVMGQDPYPKVTRATGRAFEQGDLRDWYGEPMVTPSLRRIIQVLALHRTGQSKYVATGGWDSVVADLRARRLQIEPPLPLWDRRQEQGVMFINAILTFNRAEPAFQFRGHERLWRPIIRAIVSHLAARPNKPLVCVAWGDKAANALDAAKIREAAVAADTWENTVMILRGPHPKAPPSNAPPFLTGGDRFQQINAALAAMGGHAIQW